MTTQMHGSYANRTSPNLNGEPSTCLDLPKRLIGTWIWATQPAPGSGKHLILNWRLDADDDHRAVQAQKHKSAQDLAEMVPARSDPTRYERVPVGAKRAPT
ncbi:MAG: hypothetical protein AAGH60_07600 [Pseudomonadota bacterium]